MLRFNNDYFFCFKNKNLIKNIFERKNDENK